MLGDRAVLGVVDEALGADEVEVAVAVGVAAGEQQAALGPDEGDGGAQHERPDVLVAGRAEPLGALGLLAQLRAQVAGEAAVAQPRALQRGVGVLSRRRARCSGTTTRPAAASAAPASTRAGPGRAEAAILRCYPGAGAPRPGRRGA